MKHETPERAEMARKRWRPMVRLMQLIRLAHRHKPKSELIEILEAKTEQMNERDQLYYQDNANTVAFSGQMRPGTKEKISWNHRRPAVFGPKSNLTT